MDQLIDIGRRQRKREALHQRLLGVADQLFRERGVSGTTIDDIAQAADVARQTVFNHFSYKEALALELGAESVEKIAQRAHVLLEAGSSGLDVLFRSAEWALELALEQGEVAIVVARELLHCDPQRAVRAARLIPLQHLFEAILTQAREEGEIREDLPLELVAARLSAIVTSLIAQIQTPGERHLQQDLAISFDIVFNGITRRSA